MATAARRRGCGLVFREKSRCRAQKRDQKTYRADDARQTKPYRRGSEQVALQRILERLAVSAAMGEPIAVFFIAIARQMLYVQNASDVR